MLSTHTLLLLALAGLSFGVNAANAAVFSFACVTGNSAADCNTAPQYSVDINSSGPSQVSFQFRNTASAASSILSLYFDQSTTLFNSVAQPSYSSGVLYAQDTPRPRNFPGPVAFDTDHSWHKDGAAGNGINAANEYATIRLGLVNNRTFGDVLNAMNTGQLRVGLHVGAFAGGGSEAFLSQVPEPSTYAAVLALAMVALFVVARRRTKAV